MNKNDDTLSYFVKWDPRTPFKWDPYASHTITANPIATSKKPNQPGMFGDVYIKEVIYSKPATIVIWSDKSKTISKCAKGDKYSKDTGLTLCILKKLVGPTKLHDVLGAWVDENKDRITLKDVRNKSK